MGIFTLIGGGSGGGVGGGNGGNGENGSDRTSPVADGGGASGFLFIIWWQWGPPASYSIFLYMIPMSNRSHPNRVIKRDCCFCLKGLLPSHKECQTF